MRKKATLLHHGDGATLILDGEGYILHVYENAGTTTLQIGFDGGVRAFGEPTSMGDVQIAQGYLENELNKGRVGKLYLAK